VDDFGPGGGDDVPVNHNAQEPSERGGLDLEVLSDREREVLALALTGLSARAMADQLTLTEATIRSHLSRIYAKVGVEGRVELLAKLNSHPLAPESPPLSPPVQPAPSRPHRAWPVVAALAISAVFVGVGALFLWLRPDLPPSTNLATVSQLVAQGQATNLDLHGETLTVTTKDGHRYRVDRVGGAAFSEILLPEALRANVEVIISSGDTLTPASILGPVSAFAPPIVLLVAALIVFRRFRHPPHLSPAS
jgi:DNA-binding CsgD family transcriptional regulator